MTGLIDSHAHLTDAQLSVDLQGVLDRALEAGVERIITMASDVADAARAVDLARAQERVWAAAGIHPHEAAKVAEGDWPGLEALLSATEVVACGEIGLDYHYDFCDRHSQRYVLARQLEIARATRLPLVVHCREALDDTVRLLAEKGFDGRPVVFHCFGGTADEGEMIASHGWRISFAGNVTYKSATHAQQVARAYPADKLMLETDSPYLSPVPVRGTRPNEPAHLVHTARFLAQLRGQPLGDLIETTAANTAAFFGLPA